MVFKKMVFLKNVNIYIFSSQELLYGYTFSISFSDTSDIKLQLLLQLNLTLRPVHEYARTSSSFFNFFFYQSPI